MTSPLPRDPGRWADLSARLGTGAALAATAILVFWLDGLWVVAFIGLIVAVIVWEVARMTGAGPARLVAAAAGAACAGMAVLPGWSGLPLVLAPVLAAARRPGRVPAVFALFAVLVVLAGHAMIALHRDVGLLWFVWLILVVGATDILGYFAGRAFGGPKFWPRVSPKKTWSGTVAGWAGAAAVGALFAAPLGAGAGLVVLSVAASMAAQAGDIAESALKRRMGVKDSSALLPGHGGFYDRFDGVLGAALLLLATREILAIPPLGG